MTDDSLTHWGRATHICVSKLTIIGSDNGLSPGRRQAIIWTNDRILLIRPLRTNFSESLIEIHTFSFKKMYLKMSSGKWRPFCLGFNVLIPESTKASPLKQLTPIWIYPYRSNGIAPSWATGDRTRTRAKPPRHSRDDVTCVIKLRTKAEGIFTKQTNHFPLVQIKS